MGEAKQDQFGDLLNQLRGDLKSRIARSRNGLNTQVAAYVAGKINLSTFLDETSSIANSIEEDEAALVASEGCAKGKAPSASCRVAKVLGLLAPKPAAPKASPSPKPYPTPVPPSPSPSPSPVIPVQPSGKQNEEVD